MERTQGAMRLRSGTLQDIEGMLAVKSRLMMPAGQDATTRGGFLLGSSPEQYALFVEHAVAVVLEDGGRGMIAGFAIALPDAIVRGADIWARRDAIRWEGFDPSAVEHEPIGYFEQLAILPEPRYGIYAAPLALAAIEPLVASGHRHLFATVVRRPVRNVASLPLLGRLGARRVGELDEEYAGAGRIVSEVRYIDLAGSVLTRIDMPPLERRVMEMMRRMVGDLD